MKEIFAFVIMVSTVTHAFAQNSTGIIIECGESAGMSRYFGDPPPSPTDQAWQDDQISNGKIILVNIDGEWDIRFSDAAGAYGYRQDGSEVFLVGQTNDKITIVALNVNYTDIYTFDLRGYEVIWSTHKIVSPIAKVGIYRSECSME